MVNIGKVVPTGIIPGMGKEKKPFPLRGDVIAALGELMGMTVFIFLALSGVQAALNAPAGSGDKVPSSAGPTFSQIQSVAFSFGSSITVALFLCAPISGGALNPAVLLTLLLTGNVPWFRALLLFIAELVGAILGAYFSNWVTANQLLGVNKINPGFDIPQTFFAEALGTGCLCLTVLFIIIENNVLVTFTPFVIGLVVFMCHMFLTPIDGTSINPARSFGPAVVTGDWTLNHWVFWIGPLTGAIFAVVMYLGFKSLKYDEQSEYERDVFTNALDSGMMNDRGEKASSRNFVIDNMNDPDASSARRAFGGADSVTSPKLRNGRSPFADDNMSVGGLASPRARPDEESQFSVVVEHPSDPNLVSPPPAAAGYTR
ncbi:aquaporin-like protein [Umbelopsis sp. AD052]|nr:aquaporin-like protein [Umbelopsis sp. AD052]